MRPFAELDLGIAELVRDPPCLRELLGGEVDSRDGSGRADLLGGEEDVHPRSATEVDHPLALGELGEIEEVADPRERLARPVGDAIEDVGRIPEMLGQRATQLEVVLALRLLCNVAIHVLDLRLELVGVDACFHSLLLVG